MTVRRKGAQKNQSEAVDKTSDLLEQRVVAFAEQLGLLVGTVQTKAEGWLDRKALSEEIGRIRDRAAALLEQVKLEGTLQGKHQRNRQPPLPRASVGDPSMHQRSVIENPCLNNR